MRRSIAGPFAARQLDDDLWQVIGGAPATAEIYLKNAGRDVAVLLQQPGLSMLELNWHAAGVAVAAVEQGTGLEAGAAFIHEPRGDLYEGLPLASFDSNARRFWKRVFRVMRIPGGRFLLGLIARRSR